MSGKEEFINYVNELKKESRLEMTEKASLFWEALKTAGYEEKPLFTENGRKILKHLKEHQETNMWKAKDIAEDLFIQSRSVSGAMRKLVNDNYVEKLGKDPIIYTLTEKGRNVKIEESEKTN